jgi:DNA-binding transcriptional regulator LsrR (DeoR family)
MDNKVLMTEVATLYYKKNYTQQQIADVMNLSRQTVSKLLSDSLSQGIVEIKINSPITTKEHLENAITKAFNLKGCTVAISSSTSDSVREMATTAVAVNFVLPLLHNKSLKIGLSWGKTIEKFIKEFSTINSKNSIVFPLFGATTRVNSCFSSNELAREFASKINAEVHYAYFPYKPENNNDVELFKRTSYYKNMENLWENIDIAIVGIGNKDAISLLEKEFGIKNNSYPLSDIATHTFDKDGNLTGVDNNTLCATYENIKNAKEIIAIAYGQNKVEAIISALKSNLITHFITDENTANSIVSTLNL